MLGENLDLLLPTRGLRAGEAVEAAATAERHAWRGVWVSEVLELEAFALQGAIAARTDRIRIGSAVLPITTRSAALLAMGASTLAQLAPGRVLLGLGTSTPQLVERRHDRPVTKPLAETRGVVEVVRTAVSGERVDHDRLPHVENLRLPPVDPPPSLVLAALGPKMLALAWSHTDGVALNFLPLDAAAARAREGREQAGESFETFLLLRVCVDPTTEDRRAIAKELAGYSRVPFYREHFARHGLDVSAAAEAPDLDAGAKALSDEVIDSVVVTGSAKECKERLDAYRHAGVTPLVLPAGHDGLRRILTGAAR